MRESLYNQLRARPCIGSALRTGNATTTGTAVPLNFNSQNFRTAMLVFVTGTITDGSLAVSVEESANGTNGWTAVPADRLEGTIAPVGLADDDKTYEFGVLPDFTKPYLRCSVVQSGATTGGTFGAWFILGSPNFTPVVRP